MRCHICDRVLDEPKFNSEHDDYDPCEPCLFVIQDTLDGYLDTPMASEDDLGGPEPFLTRLKAEMAYFPPYLEDE